jgi:hypothetical protein
MLCEKLWNVDGETKVMIPNISGLMRIAIVGLVVLGTCFAAGPTAAQDGGRPLLIVIDKDSIEFGVQQYQVPPDALNDLIASVGVRDPLPFFAVNVGSLFVLRSGMNGSDSWFAFQREPIRWESRAGENDALENFALAGPGLGSPDATGQRASLLSDVEDVIPVRVDRASLLVGRSICAVVYDQDLAMSADGSRIDLQGPNLGMVAFRVSAIMNVDSTWPGFLVETLDVRSTCFEGEGLEVL